MALQGSISDFGLSDIFQLIHHQKKTGTLSVKNLNEEFIIFFENGMIVLAEPTNQDPLNRIGEKLVRSGKITEPQLREALSTQKKTKDKVGQIILNMGLIGKKDLLKALAFQVKETLYGLFRLKEGEYAFKAAPISYDKNFWEPINTEFILMEGVRRVDEWPLIEKVIPNFDLIFGKIEENSGRIQGVKEEEDEELDDIFDEAPSQEGLFLTKGEMAAYEAVTGTRSVRQIIDGLGMGDFETCKALSNLLTAGLIQVLKTPQAVPSAAKPAAIKIRPARKPVFTTRNIGTLLLFAFLTFFVFSGAGNFQSSFYRNLNIFQPYKNLMLNSRFQQISFGIQTYYDLNQKLPENLDELVKKGVLAPQFAKDPFGKPIKLRLGAAGLQYYLDSGMDPK